MKATVNIDGLHALCSFHRVAVLKAKRIGCFHCCRFSKTSEIKEWIDSRKVRKGVKSGMKMAQIMKLPVMQEGLTALCPKCGIDSVLPSGTFGFRVTLPLLKAMERRWFGR